MYSPLANINEGVFSQNKICTSQRDSLLVVPSPTGGQKER